MTIKRILLGSAAVLMGVSGARAADVIVPAAEPAEYVKVCDVYGTGFYYIPGTETCMQISGYVRFKYFVDGNTPDNLDGDEVSSFSSTRVRLNFDVREETELGTLRAFARVQASNTGVIDGDAGYGMDLGYIQLGGLTMGYLDTLWTEGDGLLTDTDLTTGDFQVNRVSYTATFGAWSLAGSIEDDGENRFAPNGVLRAAYESDAFSGYLAASIDTDTDINSALYDDFLNFGPNFFLNEDGEGDDAAIALKAGLSIKPVENGELKFEGTYAFDPSVYSTIGLFNGVNSVTTINGVPFNLGSFTGVVPVEWQAGAGYAHQFGKLGVAVSGVYGETFDYYAFNGVDFDNVGSGDFYKLVGNVGYEITNNFDVLAEISYTNIDVSLPGTGSGDIEQTSGFLQFVRSF